MICPECNGKGYLSDKNGDSVCRECDGQGEYPIKAPSGFDEHLANRLTLEIAQHMAGVQF
jgi:DnaJ-class molecular chaperone